MILERCPIYNYENGATVATSKSCSNFTYGCPNPPNVPFHSDTFYLCKYSFISLLNHSFFIIFNFIYYITKKKFLAKQGTCIIYRKFNVSPFDKNTKEKKLKNQIYKKKRFCFKNIKWHTEKYNKI